MKKKALFMLAVASLGCGGETRPAATGGAAGVSSGGAAGASSGGAAGASSGGAAGLGSGGVAGVGSGGVAGVSSGGAAGVSSGGVAGAADCSNVVAAIVPEVSGKGDCTSVVRISYTTKAVLSHAFVCGPHATVTETQARATATGDSGYGSGTLVSGFAPKDEWVFYVSPGDFGGVSIVSARHGLSVFGASIVWMGKGEVLHPKSWSTAPLGAMCPKQPKPPTRGFDLSMNAPPLSAAHLDTAMNVVWGTALPEALSKTGTVLDALVLLYAPSLGFTGPPGGFLNETAEYVVMVNSGPLSPAP